MIFSATRISELNVNPFYKAVGIRLESVADGAAQSVLQPGPDMCWPTAGRPHGGVLFTVLDTTMAFAAMSNGEPGTG